MAPAHRWTPAAALLLAALLAPTAALAPAPGAHSPARDEAPPEAGCSLPAPVGGELADLATEQRGRQQLPATGEARERVCRTGQAVGDQAQRALDRVEGALGSGQVG